ncbi:MAG: selenocysteine-specific translation elongation factor [Yaniella sp.]|uniref:selenocysteine-specific translation elongation factor n=1 Tax=Yaniella sp. TaxID=2773929 RepID=UPI002647942C|nr:selenocysteine-specific translation elongation factor [Yaniella sp.]MDN5732160.1 selenocysteine-specific translation elongation factor [Yaniella sp.]MDN6350828.1 selenocysteine-specific translation elongation factor [Yaniella sp.]MDN6637444.1 selenocysteine-specific translation elongation factor [Yaniella sp.]MDN6758991.1 selenocysteine-specific translation elongation factor [Yaniella sp.]
MTEQFVVATAGHVDHGKSALVQALTGTETDRWAEERERGLTIDLGFAEMSLPSGRSVSFVDVPGHERFVGNMLAGLGPAPVVCLVVAADEGWQAQTSEHRDAIKALGISAGVVVISRLDLAPDNIGAVTAQIQAELADTALAKAPIIATSAVERVGLDELQDVMDAVFEQLAAPDVTAPIRYWVDRAFPVKGAGTVVTGTLAAGTLYINDRLELVGKDVSDVTIRSLQSHGSSATELRPVTRAAVNLRGVAVDDVSRGDVLVTPGAWFSTDVIDVAGSPDVDFTELAQEFSVHIGTATVYAHCRPLGSGFARLTLDRALPLHIGDRFLLRGTGQRLITGGATVVDVQPPELRRRGAARQRAEILARITPENHLGIEVERRRAVEQATITAMGIPVPRSLPSGVLVHDRWLINQQALDTWSQQLRDTVVAQYERDPSAGGLTEQAAVNTLELPDRSFLALVVAEAKLQQATGRISDPTLQPSLGAAEAAVAELEQRFADDPFAAPTADELDQLRLGDKELAAAAEQQRLLRLKDNIVLSPKTPALAMRQIVQLEQPFTVSDARQALDTSRRTLIPLLEHLDARGWTQRLDGNLRKVSGR